MCRPVLTVLGGNRSCRTLCLRILLDFRQILAFPFGLETISNKLQVSHKFSLIGLSRVREGPQGGSGRQKHSREEVQGGPHGDPRGGFIGIMVRLLEGGFP